MSTAAKTPIPAAGQPRQTPSVSAPDDPVLTLIARWPAQQPLAALHSADPGQAAAQARWSLIAAPSTPALPDRCLSAARDPSAGRVFRDLLPQSAAREPKTPVPIASPMLPRAKPPRSPVGLVFPPFTSGSLGYLSYDAGRLLEPTAHHGAGAPDDRAWPLAHWLRIDDALIYDHHLGQWWGLGDHAALLSSLSPCPPATLSPCQVSSLTSTTGRAPFLSRVRRALDYIRAGDVYQVNLAHRLSATFEGSPRDLFLSLSTSARPWYGAYIEFADDAGRPRAIASASPELFLDFDPRTRRIITRPMKGTRRGDADPQELLDSPKDRAELNMITDLMRNDLGRICEFGSVRVESPRDLERHGSAPTSSFSPCHLATLSPCPSVLQTTSTITGRVREGLTPADILAATFPGGSITGAPKIRAMQIIDELEPVRRGPYCGAIGFHGDDARLTLSIAIRTALLTENNPRATGPTALGRASATTPDLPTYTLDYWVGAGIVADSDPESEWEETLAKAAILGARSP